MEAFLSPLGGLAALESLRAEDASFATLLRWTDAELHGKLAPHVGASVVAALAASLRSFRVVVKVSFDGDTRKVRIAPTFTYLSEFPCQNVWHRGGVGASHLHGRRWRQYHCRI